MKHLTNTVQKAESVDVNKYKVLLQIRPALHTNKLLYFQLK